MKTNLLLLTLLVSASIASAAKPVAPMVKSSPAVPRNLGVRPLPSAAVNRVPLKPPFSSSAPLPSSGPRALPVKPASKVNTPVARSSQGFNRALAADPRVPGVTGTKAAGIAAARDAATAARDIGNIRNSLPEGLRKFGIRGNTPAGPGFKVPSFGDEGSFNTPSSSSPGINNPVDRFSKAKPRDIRGAVNGGREGGYWDTDGTWNTGPNEYMGADGSTHTVTSTERQSSTRHYNPDGKYSGRTDEAWNSSMSSVTAQHFDSDGHQTSTVRLERLPGGVEQKTVYREGQSTPEVTRSDDPVPTKSGATQSCDRNPSEGASLGGARGPSVKQVSGLTNLDLLRQVAEGQSATGGNGGYFVNGGRQTMNQVRPVGEGSTGGMTNRVGKIDTLQPTGGGTGSTGGGDRPD